MDKFFDQTAALVAWGTSTRDRGGMWCALSELRYGADRRGSRKLPTLIDTFASAIEVASFDEVAAAEFGRIGSILAERGTPIGDFDVLIAAHAVVLRCTLVTNNIRHFSKVPGLSVENWT